MNWPRYFSLHVVVIFFGLSLTGCLEENATPLKIGADVPPSTLTLLNGKTTELADHPGKARVITFMSSWCPCSNESIPLLKQAWARSNSGSESKVAFLMIGIQDSESKFVDKVNKWNLPFPAGYDDGDKIARTFGVTAPPTTVFIDVEGKVKRVYYGNIKDNEADFDMWMSELQ